MSFLREMGLTAALLAATGGAAIATWSYITARRRKEAGHGAHPEQEHGADKLKTEQPAMGTPSSPGTQGAQTGFSQAQRGEQAAETGTLVLPGHTQRAGGEHSKQEESTSQTETAEREKSACTVQVHHTSQTETAEREKSVCTVQVHHRSQTETAEREQSACTVQVHHRSQTETAEREKSVCTLQVHHRSQPETSTEIEESACTVQVHHTSQTETAEREQSACTAQVHHTSQTERSAEGEHIVCTAQVQNRSQPERSAVQVDAETEVSACAVQVNERFQPERSAVQEKEGSSYAVQVDERSQPEGSEVQVGADTNQSVQEDITAEPLSLPVEPPILKELSDSNICAEIQSQVKVSLRQQVVVLGLDGAGKTSVLNSIAANKGKFMTTPTAGVNALCVSNGTSKMEFLEIGGSEHLRPYWKMYLSKAFAVIFVVDSADHGRLPLAKRHLHQLIQQDAIIPLLVLANKQDLKNAYHITEIHEALGLSDICENRKLFLIGTYVTKEESEVSSGILDTKEFLAQLHAENSAIRS